MTPSNIQVAERSFRETINEAVARFFPTGRIERDKAKGSVVRKLHNLLVTYEPQRFTPFDIAAAYNNAKSS